MLLFVVVGDYLQPNVCCVLGLVGRTSSHSAAVFFPFIPTGVCVLLICQLFPSSLAAQRANHRINMIDEPDLNHGETIFSRPPSAAEPTGAACESSISVCFLGPSGTLKLSQTSPDVPNSEVGAHPHKDLPNAHSQQQVTSRSVGLVGLVGVVGLLGLKRCTLP